MSKHKSQLREFEADEMFKQEIKPRSESAENPRPAHESTLTPCPAILIHPLAHQLIKRILETDANCDPEYPGDVDLRLYAIIKERGELRETSADLLAILREAVKERDDEPERYPIHPWCNHCTEGSTPMSFDRGLCWYHRALRAIARAEGT